VAVEQNISADIFARLDGQDPQGNICHKIREFYENRKKSAAEKRKDDVEKNVRDERFSFFILVDKHPYRT
jgi:hypothetical protein